MSDTTLGLALASAALLLFTAGTLVTKAAAKRLDLGLGFVVATFVNVVFSAAVLGVQWLLRGEAVTWNAMAFWLFALAGFFATYLGRWFFYESVVRFGPAKASVFQVSSPLFTALIAWALLGESLSPAVATGMLLTVAGLVLVSLKPGVAKAIVAEADAPASPPLDRRTRLLQSVLFLGLCSSLAYAAGNVLRGMGIRRWNEPVLGALVGALCGLALHLLFMRDKAGLLRRLCTASRGGLGCFALLGVTTISAQMCSIASMRYIPLSIATLITLCTPLLVFPLSHWLRQNHDPITPRTLAGCGMTLLGIGVIVLR
ncbi:hypothetical protein RD110_25755 [Rhodoferax koreense]|uniref:EamA domain-containing protein n=1 Tax=Rhodoferax koreensis TaxID=1842727 RepID=A0A1P8K2F0_9BURK|nr:DMT family transporter [Rhodoferax koreense]APW40185.1 hypothetical protein RD110_25755 [Rhodoferax koreense]